MYYITISTIYNGKEYDKTVAVSDNKEMVKELSERFLKAYKSNGAFISEYREDYFVARFGKKFKKVSYGLVERREDYLCAITL